MLRGLQYRLCRSELIEAEIVKIGDSAVDMTGIQSRGRKVPDMMPVKARLSLLSDPV